MINCLFLTLILHCICAIKDNFTLTVFSIIIAPVRPRADTSCSSDSDDEQSPSKKRNKREADTDRNFKKLKEKFSSQWPDYKLRSWATMVVRINNSYINVASGTAYEENRAPFP